MALLQELFQSPSTVTLLAALLLFLVFWLLSTNHSPGKEPPGPRPFPLIGNLLQLDRKKLDLSLWRLSKTHGSVFTVHFGPKKVVVLTGYKTVKEALVNYAVEFGEREISPILYDISEGHGVLFSNGDSWKEMRHFVLSTLQDLGMGKRGSEEKIIEEIHYMTEVFENFKGKPFEASEAVNRLVSNIISSIVYGSRFEYDDPEFQSMVNRGKENVRLMVSPTIQLYNMFPRLGPWLKDWVTLKKNIESNKEQVKGLVKNLQETLNTEERRCLVDSFLIRQQEIKKSGEQESSYYYEKNLIITVTNLFAAGTDSTVNTLRWGLLLMAKYPHIQDRVQEELDMVTGGRQTRMVDRKNLPYTDAVMHEIQRLANVAPMSIPHITSCDVVFQGYHIKKGATVIPLLTSVLYDESEWETPHSFNPGHFLDDQGRFRKRDAFLPFSAGRRACLGESLARMEIFLFFTSLLQKFRFTPPPGVSESDLDLTPCFGLTLGPSPHKLCAVSRLSKKYGSVFTVHFGPKKVVVLTGFKTVKEALVNHAEEFGERDIFPLFYDVTEGHGVLFSNGDSWKEMRRFALSTLRDLGMGKRGSEEKIIEEIHYMTEVFENFKGEPFDTTRAVNYSVSNIISSIVYGSRFEYDDPEFQRLVNLANESTILAGSPAIQLYNMFPRLGPWLKDWVTLMKIVKTNIEQVKGLVKNLQETLNTEDRRCLVDSFLIRQQEIKKSREQEFYYHEKNLIITVSNLFGAGTDTTATTLRWGLMLMAKYPHIQDRVQEELDMITGGRQTRVEDRKNLPYTDAVIHEIQRLANISPMSLPHITSCDVVFQGYHIKKGTTVIPLLTSVLYDESEWETPHTFNPGHFLDDQGRFRKRDAFLPFSAGRRACLGESLARMEIFLFFTSLLQKFHFTPPPGVSESDLDLTPVVGFTLNPSLHKLCAISRG